MLQLMLLSRKVPREPGGGQYLPILRHLYQQFKESGGAYTTNVGFGQMVVATRPEEFVKVIQNEGKYPDGLVPEMTEPFRKYMPSLVDMLPAPELYGRDDKWLEMRRFLQTGLLAPKSARGHLQSISKSAQLASRVAGMHADSFGFYLNRCAFDAFSSVMFGQFTNTADLESQTDQGNLEFMKSTLHVAREITRFEKPVLSYFAGKLGYETVWQRDFMTRFKHTISHIDNEVETFIAKMESGKLNEYEQQSYFARALDRQQEGGSMSPKQVVEIAWTMLVTSVDTTSSILYIAILSLALNPTIQQRLAEELLQYVGKEGIQDEMLLGKAPGLHYLDAFLRECHRIRPSIGPVQHFKKGKDDLEIHGYRIPKETLVVFDSYSIQNDLDLVPDSKIFRPDRWLPEEVNARKGTVAQVIDHNLLSKPFSSGARICPAARVASIEIQCIVAQLVMDWNFDLRDTRINSIEEFPYTPFVPGLLEPFPKLKITRRC